YVLHTDLIREDIVLCHDVGPLTHPELFDSKTTELYRAAYERIRAVEPGMVFVSQSSRAAFQSTVTRNSRFHRVIPLYVRKPSALGPSQDLNGIKPPFLLTVAGIEKRKNHGRIIEAFKLSRLSEQGYSYVFCGPRGNSALEIAALAAATRNVHA